MTLKSQSLFLSRGKVALVVAEVIRFLFSEFVTESSAIRQNINEFLVSLFNLTCIALVLFRLFFYHFCLKDKSKVRGDF